MFEDRGFGKEGLRSGECGVCREAGGRVVTNMFVRDMDLGVPVAGDNRRLEVVVDGLPLHGGVQLAVDTTLVSSVRGSGEPRQGAKPGQKWPKFIMGKTRTSLNMPADGPPLKEKTPENLSIVCRQKRNILGVSFFYLQFEVDVEAGPLRRGSGVVT